MNKTDEKVAENESIKGIDREDKPTIEKIPISEIIPYNQNPRKNDKAVDIVSKSIDEFGFINPIILDKNNIIVAGHTRLKAAVKLGLNQIPVIWADYLSDDQIKSYRIMDNKSSEYASWDIEALKGEITELRGNYDLSLTGFSETELDKIAPIDPIEENIPEPSTPKYKIKQGELWQLGNHRLLCGDCTKEENVNRLMNGQKIDMVLTDPPYGVDYAGKNAYLIEIGKPNRNENPIKNDKGTNIHSLMISFFYFLSLSDYNTIYVFSSGKNIAEMIYAFREAGFYYCQDLKWIKNNHVLGRLDYNPKSENILYGWKDKHKFYGGFQTDVIYVDRPNSSKEHPTMKPVTLLIILLNHGSTKNSVVYDGFGGSGSTLIACEQTNRKCFMMEIDENYCSVIIERWQNLTNKKAELIP